MREKPIIFSGPMVLAILSGAKTQTRRVIRLTNEARAWFEKWGECVGPPVHEAPGHYRWPSPVSISFAHDGRPGGNTAQNAFSPYGVPGDMLWVRETWGIGHRSGMLVDPCLNYRADNSQAPLDPREHHGHLVPLLGRDGWRPSIHMPRWASRISLEVTEVRVQRLQDISVADCIAEGVSDCCEVEPDEDPREVGYSNGPYSYARDNYRRLWDEINGDRAPWSSNPFVWAISFRRLP